MKMVINENYRYLYGFTALSLLTYLSLFNLWVNILLSFICYLSIGGWRFIKILILTGPRDLNGLKILLTVKFKIWQMSRNKYTIPDLFEQTLQHRGSANAFMFEDETWSFNEVDKYSNKIANYLLKISVKPGDTVALFMENRPVYVAIWLGIAKIGAVPALINFNLRGSSLLHCIRDGSPVGLIIGSELTQPINDIYDDLENDLSISPPNKLFKLVINGHKNTANNSNNICTVTAPGTDDSAINGQSNKPIDRSIRRNNRNSSDPLLFIYTSGTTGLPKAAKVTHIRFVLMSFGVNQFFRITPKDIIYNSLPLYHTAGGMIGVGQVLIVGACMAVRRKFSASNYWIDVRKYNATVIQYIGEVCRYLLAQPVKEDLEQNHKVRLAFGNGIRPQIWTEFQERFCVPNIGEFYGATESNCNIVNNVNKVGSVGYGTRIAPFLYPVILIRVDLETGEPIRDKKGLCIKCRPNETGELVGKIQESDPLRRFDGYVNRGASDKKVVYDVFHKGDSGFSSGDLLSQDELGFFYFKDRLGDTFRWKGENVSTAEVEAVISNTLELHGCVVYGVEISNCEGRAGMVAITNDSDNHINHSNSNGVGAKALVRNDIQNLPKKMKDVLPPYAQPVFVRLCHNIEMTGTFKMKKINLVKEGYDPNLITDPLFYLDVRKCQYCPVDSKVYAAIMKGEIKF